MAIEKLGPYRIHEMLGRGGMGTVYAGVHDVTGEKAAIKVLSLLHSDDSNFRERFSTEIESLKKLKHENIVELFGYGEHDGHLFYAMEMIRGASLQQMLSDGHRFTWSEVTDIGSQVCRALKHAHDRGIIHRDLKPANLLVAEDETIKLSDFGIAKLFGASQLTADGGVVGTADYMAPEQSAGLPTTTRTDMFSLGCVLYALLVGRPPFASTTAAEAIHRLRYEDPPQLSRRVLDLPAEMEEIVTHLLEKEPADRIATPLALSNRLMAMVHGLAGQDPAPPPPGEVVLTPDRPTEKSQPAVPGLNTSSRSTVVVPEDQDAVRVQVAGPESDADDFETNMAPSGPRENRFITADEARRADSQIADNDDSSPWLKLLAVVLFVAAVAAPVWFFTRPISEDKLYEQIKTAANKDDPEQLAGRSNEVEQFLKRFPQSERTQEIVQYKEEIELFRAAQRFDRRRRRRGATESLSVVERLYLDALRMSGSEPAAALRRFRALIDLFDDGEQSAGDRRCLQLARAQIDRLRAVLKNRQQETLQTLRSRLARAASVQATDQQQSIRICRGLIALYGKEAWAREVVQEATRLLAELQ